MCWEPGFHELSEAESDQWVCAGGKWHELFLQTMRRTPWVVTDP